MPMKSDADGCGLSVASGWISAQVDEGDGSPDGATFIFVTDLAGRIRLRPVRDILGADAEGRFSIPPDEVAITARNRSAERLFGRRSPFRVKVVDTKEAAAEVRAAFDLADDRSRWPASGWIETSMKKGYSVLAARIRGPVAYGGMAAFSRVVQVAGDEDGSVDVFYNFHPEYLYVMPKARGRRLSSALRFAMSEVIADDIEVLHYALSPTGKSDLRIKRLSFYVYAEAHSREGLRFLDGFADDFEEAVESEFADDRTDRLVLDREVIREYGL